MSAHALLLTQNNIADDIINIFENEDIALSVHKNWNEVEEQNYFLYLIDQEILEAKEDVYIPPSAYLIVLLHEKSFESARRFMKKRAYDMLVVPDELDRLSEVLKSIEVEQVQPTTTFDGGNGIPNIKGGQVLSFYSGKGGSGKSVLSSLVAQSLQAIHDKKTLLIDMNVQYGGQDVLLGVEPHRTYADLKPVLNELDIHHISNVITTEEHSYVDVLLSPAQPEQSEEITGELISAIIRTAKAYYDYVLLDLPSEMNVSSFTALNESSEVYYILTPDSLALRSFRHVENMFTRLSIEKLDNIHVLLNGNHAKSELTPKDVAQLINRKLAGTFSSDYDKLQPYINKGLPVFGKNAKPKIKLGKEVNHFVKNQLFSSIEKG